MMEGDGREWVYADTDSEPWSALTDPALFSAVEDAVWRTPSGGKLPVPDNTEKTVDLIQEDGSMLLLLCDPSQETLPETVRGYDIAYELTEEWVSKMYGSQRLQDAFFRMKEDFDTLYGVHQFVVHPDDRDQTYGQQGVQYRQDILESDWENERGAGIAAGTGPDPDLIYSVVRWREKHGDDSYGPERPVYHIAKKYGGFQETDVTFESGGFLFRIMYRAPPEQAVDPAAVEDYFGDTFVTDRPQLSLSGAREEI